MFSALNPLKILGFGNTENKENKENKEPYNYKELIRQVLEGLKCMNEYGFVHLDIKLENIGIDNDGNAKIFDFGFARYLIKDPTDFIEDPFGTSFYADPEIIFLKKIYKNSDIYSLGSLLYQSIIEDNSKSIEIKYRFNGKHYTNYYGIDKVQLLDKKFIDINESKNEHNIPIFKEPIEFKKNDEMKVKNELIGLIIYAYDINIIKELIKKMMKYDATKRISFEELLKDEWFTNDEDRRKVYNVAQEEARLKAEEEAKLKAEKEAKLKAAKLKAEEEARLKAEYKTKYPYSYKLGIISYKLGITTNKPGLKENKGGKHLSKKIIYKKNKYKPETPRSQSNRSNKCNKKCSKRKNYGNAYSTLRKTKRMNKWYNL